MHIADFHYHRPGTLDEALQLLDAKPDGVLLAGGTDLLVDLKQGKRFHPDVISLTRIPDLGTIEVQDGSVFIGAAVTHNQFLHSPLIQQCCPAVGEAAQTIGTEQIRNTATVGGNLCTAASCADTAPILIAHGAGIEIVGNEGRRTMPLAEFFVDHRQTALERGEILTKIIVPIPLPGTGAAFEKFGLRGASNISVASVATMVRVADGHCTEACFVMGAVAPTPKVSVRAAELVQGRTISAIADDPSLLERVGQAVADDAAPIDDIRGTAEFRREITATLAQRALTAALRRVND
jgi:CO/xanthine dehydrogenase FAD-binding subunit